MMMMRSVFWWRKPEYPEETTDIRHPTDEADMRGSLFITSVHVCNFRPLFHFNINVGVFPGEIIFPHYLDKKCLGGYC